MIIEKFRLQNYKSYRDSGELTLTDGFNLVVGRNSAGKTALLQTLRAEFDAQPHRSPATMPSEGDRPLADSTAEFVFRLHASDFRRFLLGRDVPLPVGSGMGASTDGDAAALVNAYLARDDWPIGVSVRQPVGGAMSVVGSDGPAIPAPYEVLESAGKHLKVRLHPDGRIEKRGTVVHDGVADLANILLDWARSQIYAFSAERLSIGQASSAPRVDLESDASNLAQVLNALQPNPTRWEEFNALVREVLPEIRWISVRSVGASKVEVYVWYLDPKEKREDLAVPLRDCGTGVGQVLSMLYVVLTSVNSRVIVIDEPQSFLHPGAIRALFRILRRYAGKHQFIVSTHLPGVVVAAGPSRVLRIQLEGMESKVLEADGGDTEALRAFLHDVGASVTDVFGADRILWVEGETEGAAFPAIDEDLQDPLSGTRVLHLASTGDIDVRHRAKKRSVLQAYERLTKGGALIPPSYAFLVDREQRSDDERQTLWRDSSHRIHFLKRRMFENYLLHPKGIRHAMELAIKQGLPDDVPVPELPTEDEIGAWLERAKEDGEPLDNAARSAIEGSSLWEVEVDGARLLEDLFAELNDGLLEFAKTRDSKAIAEWLAENEPDALQEVREQIRHVLDCMSHPQDCSDPSAVGVSEPETVE